MGALATSACDRTLLFYRRGGKLQQLGQRGGARTVHGRAHCRLDCVQIQMPGLAPATENDAQESIYFARDFLADRFCSFFPCAVSVSSSGRTRQIFSLTATKDRSNCR